AFHDGLLTEVERCLQAGPACITVEWAELLHAPRQALSNTHAGGLPATTAAAQPPGQWARPVVYVRPEPFTLVGPPAAAPDRERLLGELTTLRRLRRELGARGDVPAPVLAGLDARIDTLEQQLFPA